MTVYLIDSYYLLYLIRVKANRTFIRKFVSTLDLTDGSKLYSPNIIFSLVQIAKYLRNKKGENKSHLFRTDKVKVGNSTTLFNLTGKSILQWVN